MPDMKGRFSHKEKLFVQHMARTNDATYAATKAGYAFPDIIASKLRNHPILANATRDLTQQFLRDKGGGIGVYILAELALDAAIPANTRRAAAKDLAGLSGIAIGDGVGDKLPSEMTPGELSSTIGRMTRQLDALRSASADAARPIVDAEPAKEEHIPNSSVFE